MPRPKPPNPQLLTPILLTLTLLISCAPPSPQSSGEDLARLYCASCHQFPEPALLDRNTWVSSTLPVMGNRMGIYEAGVRDSLVAPLIAQDYDHELFFPSSSVLSKGDWQAIVSYYAEQAPETLERVEKQPLQTGIPGFSIHPPALSFDPPYTTMVQLQEEFNAYFVGNYASNSTLVLLNDAGQLMYQFDLPGAPVATRVDGQRLYILVIGAGPEPTVAANGAVYVVDDPSAGPELLIDNLLRPVDFELSDLNSDGRMDLVICEYGHYKGALAWYEQTSAGAYTRHVLKDGPGAIQAEIYDFDGDGMLDIGALMAQGDEGLDIYIGKGDGVFEQERVLWFPPVYGSTSFSLVDFNQDGNIDILYTNGDNADSSPILKKYHGVRIFQGSGAREFEEVLFYPLNGAFSAKATDFDDDGSLDIAAISYFPDYVDQPEESFVLLMDEGDAGYVAYSFEQSFRGRWMVIDVGDIDGDTDPDILLGSNIGFGPRGDETGLFNQWEREALSYIILENERL